MIKHMVGICFLFIMPLSLYAESVDSSANKVGAAEQKNISIILSEARNNNWRENLTQELIEITSNERESSLVERIEACYHIVHNIQNCSYDEKNMFTSNMINILNSDEPEEFRIMAIRSLTNICLFDAEHDAMGKTSANDNQAINTLLQKANLASTENERVEAIKAVGVLKVRDAIDIIKNIIETENESNIELVKAACISLVRIDSQEAFPSLKYVIETCNNPSLYSTALYCISFEGNPKALRVIIDNKNRFPDLGATAFSVTDMEPVINEILSDPYSPDLEYAIEATVYYWRESQKETAWIKLIELLPFCLQPIQSQVVSQLIVLAGQYNNDEMKQRLKVLLNIIENIDSMISYKKQLNELMSATVIIHSEDTDELTPYAR